MSDPIPPIDHAARLLDHGGGHPELAQRTADRQFFQGVRIATKARIKNLKWQIGYRLAALLFFLTMSALHSPSTFHILFHASTTALLGFTIGRRLTQLQMAYQTLADNDVRWSFAEKGHKLCEAAWTKAGAIVGEPPL